VDDVAGLRNPPDIDRRSRWGPGHVPPGDAGRGRPEAVTSPTRWRATASSPLATAIGTGTEWLPAEDGCPWLPRSAIPSILDRDGDLASPRRHRAERAW